MDRDEMLSEGAKLERLGVDLGWRREGDAELYTRRDLVERLGAGLAGSRVFPVLVGESGVGKNALVTTLARAMASRDASLAPPSLRGGRIIEVTVPELISGAIYANHLEHKVRLIAENCAAENAVLFFDNIASFVGSGTSSSDPENDVPTLFAPFLSRGSLRIIAATTPDGWMRLARSLPEFARLLTPIEVPETTHEETLLALAHRTMDWGRRYCVRISRAALDETIDLAERLFPWRRLPGRACNLLESALAFGSVRRARSSVRSERGVGARREAYGSCRATADQSAAAPQVVDSRAVAEAVRDLTGLPDFLLDPSRPARRDTLLAMFRREVVGQDAVVETLVDRIQMIKARLCAPGRPLAAFLLAGPTGVGKTLVARTLSRLLLGDESRLIRFDMSEFSSVDDVGRFIGSGKNRGEFGLVDAALAEPFPVILLDEIEKANWRVFDALLQVLGEGRLTDGLGRTAYFWNAVVLMTSNLGWNRPVLGFPGLVGSDGEREDRVCEELRQFFRPELLNRLTDILVFRPLERTEIRLLVQREVVALGARRGLAGRSIELTLTDAALDALATAGYSRDLGARPMARALESMVGVPLARVLAEQPDARNTRVVIDFDGVAMRPRTATATHAPTPGASKEVR